MALRLAPLALATQLPDHLLAHVAELARYVATPSAQALKAHLEACPWVPEMIACFPRVAPSLIILQACWLGLEPCRKCNSCAYATLHEIRRQYDPDMAIDDCSDSGPDA